MVLKLKKLGLSTRLLNQAVKSPVMGISVAVLDYLYSPGQIRYIPQEILDALGTILHV